MATIITKNSSTASSVPTAAQLVKGELAVNVTDKRLFTEDNSGNIVELGTNPSTFSLPNGTANGVAYLNGSKVLTTGSALTFDGTNLGVGTASPGSFLYSGLTVGGGTGNIGLTLFSSTTGIGSIAFADSASGAARYAGHIRYLHSSNAFTFDTEDVERMRLTSTGLGIGTSSPTNTLSVSGNANITGNTTLGDASTDTVTVNGYMSVGGSASSTISIYARNSALTGVTQYGVYSGITASSSATTAVNAFTSDLRTEAASFTVSNLRGFFVADATKGAGSTITNQHGVYIADLTQGTNNYGITSRVSSGTNKWNIYASGTAANYFAGNVQFAAGSAAAPALTRFGDDNTGIFFPAADTIAFSEGGVERMRLDSSGNVGIGTSTPTTRLQVTGAVENTNAASGTGVLRLTGGASTYSGYIGFDASTMSIGTSAASRGLSFAAGAAERMRIDSSGNLGLGVTPSASWQSLRRVMQVGGNIALWGQSSGAGSLFLSNNTYYDGTNFRYLNTSGAGYYAQATDGSHTWNSAPSGTAGNAISFTQAMTLDASGNLGVGTTSPSARLHVKGGNTNNLKVDNGGEQYTEIDWLNNGTTKALAYWDNTNAQFFISAQAASSTLVFGTAATERARITSGGDLLVGTTTAGAGWGAGGKLTVDMGSSYTVLKSTNGAGSPELLCWSATGTSDNLFITFATETGGTTRGTIDYNRAVGLTRYNTTSDYRAKTVKGPVDNPLQRVMQLKPCTGRMNEATEDIDFFVAHELQSIVPSAVSGEKDAVNEDGTPKYQLVDKSALIPLLTAAIQEQQAIITDLRARVAALEAA